MTDPTTPTRIDFDSALDELAKVQQEVVDSLLRGAKLANDAKDMFPPDMLDDYDKQPIEAILKAMITANELAADDRTQVARLIALIDRLNLQVDARLAAIEENQTAVAADLEASRKRADAAAGPGEDAGAAADAAASSAD